jgi:GNAT superfamily N-acetyltransferase
VGLSTEAPIRRADPAEAEAIAALVNAAYAVEASFIRGTRTDVKEVRAHLLTGWFLVAGQPESLEGCVYVEPQGSLGYFGLLSVRPEKHGQGLGRRLVAAAEEDLRQARCQTLEIQVVNLRRELFPFYAHLGYVEAGTVPFPEKESARLLEPCHFVLMRKAISARE